VRAGPDKIAQTLTVSARDVVDRRFDAALYPHRHLAVVQVGKLGGPDAHIPLVMGAVETLGQLGWELVAFTMVHRTVMAVMRRPG
jgi:hypothetical protein